MKKISRLLRSGRQYLVELVTWPKRVRQLKLVSRRIKQETLTIISQAGSGHPASCLGLADIMTALYFQVLKHRPQEPNWPDRDFLLVSNGHIAPLWYTTLSLVGYFPQTELTSLRQINSRLQGHPKLGCLPGIENTSGSLGQGLSQAVGLALALKRAGRPNHVYCLTSDGEHQEGQTWEAYLLAAKYQLNNLTVIIDRNYIQIEGPTEKILPLSELAAKVDSFGWQPLLINGHNFWAIARALTYRHRSQPSAVIAYTVPGQGIAEMENDYHWHGQTIDPDQLPTMIAELEK